MQMRIAYSNYSSLGVQRYDCASWSIFVNICYNCWYLLIFVDIRWYLLIFVDICWYLFIFGDICSYLLIFVDICWYLIQQVGHTKRFWNGLVILRIDIYVNAHSIYQLFVPWCPKVRLCIFVDIYWYLLIFVYICSYCLILFDIWYNTLNTLRIFEMTLSFCA